MSHFATWLFTLMMLFSPPEKMSKLRAFSAAPETAEEMTERYKVLATDLEEVVSNPDERLLFGGKRGREHTAGMMLAVVWMESGLRADVQKGIGKYAKGGGIDAGLPQIRLGAGQRTAEGWTAEELLADTKKQFRAELHLLKGSFYACRTNVMEERMAAYASGTCIRGQESSRARYAAYKRMMTKLPLPEQDAVAPVAHEVVANK